MAGSDQREGKNMCKKYTLKAKRPNEKEYSEWCSTNDGETIKRNVEVVESYGYRWRLTGGEQENERNGS